MKTYKEFITESREKRKFKKALRKFKQYRQEISGHQQALQTETEPGSNERANQIRQHLMPQQGAAAIERRQKIERNLESRFNRYLDSLPAHKREKKEAKIRNKVQNIIQNNK
jgi:hypothetical protein